MFDLAVIGLGYVGLPLACLASERGMRVVGFDTNIHRIESLSRGESHVDDLSDDDIARALVHGFQPSGDEFLISRSRVIVICVPTPLDSNGEPDLSFLEAAGSLVSRYLSSGSLVILESTTYPGTTDDLLVPLLAKSGLIPGTDFHVAFSPERIDPGNKVYNLKNTPKVVGGIDEESTARARDFYLQFIDEVVEVASARDAEFCKLLENSYRLINISFVNELTILCHELNINIWDAIRAASSKPFGFHPFLPGPGIGGHCIPIDPLYLQYAARKVGQKVALIEAARDAARRAPQYVCERVFAVLENSGIMLSNASVLIVGVSYKKNSSDVRETPAADICEVFLDSGLQIRYFDPHVPEWELLNRPLRSETDLRQASGDVDIVLILQDHDSIDFRVLPQKSKYVFDTRNCVTGPNVYRL